MREGGRERRRREGGRVMLPVEGAGNNEGARAGELIDGT